MSWPKFMQDKGPYAKEGELSLGGLGILFTAGILAFILAIGALAWKLNSYSCHVAETRYHKATKYILLSGCYINVDRGNWIRLGQYQNFRQVKP